MWAPWTDTASTAFPSWLMRAALLALAAHAFFSMTDFVLPEFGAMAAFLLLPFCGWSAWREWWAQPFMRGTLVVILFLILHSAYVRWSVWPTIRYSAQLSVDAKLIRMLVFTGVIGWWLSWMPRAIPWLLGAMVAGLLLAVAVYLPWGELPAILDGHLRPRFGIPENVSGVAAAMAGWMALCLLIVRRPEGGYAAVWWPLCLLLAYGGCFGALLFSQSRGAWLAFAATLPLALLGYLWFTRWRELRRVPVWGALGSAALMSFCLLFAARDLIVVRMAGVEQLLPDQEQSQLQHQPSSVSSSGSKRTDATKRISSSGSKVAAEDDDRGDIAEEADKPDTAEVVRSKAAVSIRMQLYELGVARFQERPWFGWGLRTTPSLIAFGRLELGGQRHVHLHNAYLDALVGLGIVGTVLLLGVLSLLLVDLVGAWWRGNISAALFWALAGCIGIVLVANGFDSLLWRLDVARGPLELILGACLAYGLIRRREAAATR